MGTWSAYLAFRAPADVGTLLPKAERRTWTNPGWTFLEDRIEEAWLFEEKLKDLPGPALITVVRDSDFAQVVGYTDAVEQWEVFVTLHPLPLRR